MLLINMSHTLNFAKEIVNVIWKYHKTFHNKHLSTTAAACNEHIHFESYPYLTMFTTTITNFQPCTHLSISKYWILHTILVLQLFVYFFFFYLLAKSSHRVTTTVRHIPLPWATTAILSSVSRFTNFPSYKKVIFTDSVT